MARKTNKDVVLEGLQSQPALRSLTNREIAAALKVYNPVSVSQALSALHKEGKIRVWFDGELHPRRHIDVNG